MAYLKPKSWGWGLVSLTTVLWLLWMTLRPDRTLNSTNLIPFAEHSRALACLLDSSCLYQRHSFWFLLINIVGNVAVFIPLGLGLAGLLHTAHWRQTLWQATLGGFLVSLTIELVQLTIPSRATDIDDLIFNTTGVILGVLLFLWLQRSSPPGGVTAA